MADRPFIFRDGRKELVLPVTPSAYRVGPANNMEVINIHELGDVVLSGYGTLQTIQIACMYPNHSYNFTEDDDSRRYIKQFNQWVKNQKTIRFIVGNTRVNIPVRVESHLYGERDGTTDIYAELTLREYRELEPIQVQKTAVPQKPRPAMQKESKTSNYSVVYGDTLSALCYKYYGDASAATYNKVAKLNGMKSPHILFPGDKLKFPQPLK